MPSYAKPFVLRVALRAGKQIGLTVLISSIIAGVMIGSVKLFMLGLEAIGIDQVTVETTVVALIMVCGVLWALISWIMDVVKSIREEDERKANHDYHEERKRARQLEGELPIPSHTVTSFEPVSWDVQNSKITEEQAGLNPKPLDYKLYS